MFRLTVTRENQTLHTMDLPDLATAQFWEQEIIYKNEWNFATRTELVPERIEVIPAVPEQLDETGQALVPAQPEQTMVYPAYERQIADVVITIEDITEQVAYDQEIEKRVQRIAFGNRLFAELATRNVARLKAGQTTIQNILAAEQKLSLVQRYMANSSLEVALQALTSLDIPELPTSEKDYFAQKISQYLQGE